MAELIGDRGSDRLAASGYGTEPVVRRQPSKSQTGASMHSPVDQTQRTSVTSPIPSGDGVRLVNDEESGRPFIQILDRRTGEVIYEIPTEALKKLPKLFDRSSGVVIDTVA